MNIVHLKNNYGYNWYTYKNIKTKGYLFDRHGKLWKDEELPQYFTNCESHYHLYNKLKESNGLFSVTIEKSDMLMAAVDKIRMFPLFYKTLDSKLYITDDPSFLTDKSSGLDPLAVNEFLATGYVTGKDILLNNVYQIEAGQILIYSKQKTETIWYHQMISNNNLNADHDLLRDMLIDMLEKMFLRTGELAKDKKIAIPLSGGFDSRLIAMMIKEHGFNDVICFSYGRKNNKEAVISEKVAKILGFPWFFIEYNDDICKNYLHEKEFEDYALFTSNYCSMPYLQEYFAVKYLRNNKIIDNDTIILAGHSMGAIVGGRISPKFSHAQKIEKTADLIYNDNYTLVKPEPEIKEKLKRKIISQITLLSSKNLISGEICQNWELKERQAKFISNSTNVFNWFGCKHSIPFLNLDFMEFYANIDLKQKICKKMYREVLANKYFKPHGLLFEYELQANPIDHKIHAFKNKFKPLVPSWILKDKLLKADWPYYGVLTKEMEKQLLENNIKPSKCRNSFNEMIVQWFIYFIQKVLYKKYKIK